MAYVDLKWPHAARNSRDRPTETLATVAPVLVRHDAPEALGAEIMWTALRAYYLAPKDRNVLVSQIWPMLSCGWRRLRCLWPRCSNAGTCGALNALTLLLNGKPAAAKTVARKRAVLYNAFEYAVELDESDRNPIDKVKWTPSKLAEEVDWRVMIGPRQMRECLTAVTYVGKRGRGRRLRAVRVRVPRGAASG